MRIEETLSKTKNKTHSEVENSRGIIRELQKEVKSLRQQLRQYEKYDRSQDSDNSYDSEDTKVDLLLTKDCIECGKGKVVESLQLQDKVYGTCSHCGCNARIK